MGGTILPDETNDKTHQYFSQDTTSTNFEYDEQDSSSGARARQDRFIIDWWSEACAAGFSVLSLTTVAGVLASFDGLPLAAWNYAISPNAAISSLVVASKAALLYSTTSCIGQLKWNRFHRQACNLSELQAFDDAGRGLLGAVTFIPKTRALEVTMVLGCAVVLISVLAEPFGQQILSFPNVPTRAENGSATYPTSRYVPWAGWDLPRKLWYFNAQAAVINGMNGVDPIWTFTCPTSSCKWETAASLGFCSSCRDVTSMTTSSCRNETKAVGDNGVFPGHTTMSKEICTFEPPDSPDLQLNLTTFDGMVQSVLEAFNSSVQTGVFGNIANELFTGEITVLNYTALFAPNISQWREPQVHQCELTWCTWVWDSAESRGDRFSSSNIQHFPLINTGSDYTKILTATGNFPQNLNATFAVDANAGGDLEDAVMLSFLPDAEMSYRLAASDPDLVAVFDGIATSLTKAPLSSDTTDITGTAWEDVTYIHVRWMWLIMPAVVVLGAIVLLLLTVVQTAKYRTPLWKLSTIAYLFRAPSGWEAEDLDAQTLREMGLRAKKMRGQLKRDLGDSRNDGMRIFKT